MGVSLLLLSLATALAGYGDRIVVIEGGEAFSAGPSQEVSQSPWWQSFGEPTLQGLVETGLSDSPALASGQARVDAAQAQSWSVLSPVLPQVSVDFGHQIKPCPEIGFAICDFSVPTDENGIPTQEIPDTYAQGSLYLNAGMNLDIFGAAYNSNKASRLEAAAAGGDVEAQALMLSVQVGGAYLDWLTAAEQLALVERQLRLNQELLEIVELNYQASTSTAVDLLQQRQSLAQVQTSLPSAQAQLRLQEQQLAVLTGQDPSQRLDLVVQPLPELPASPALGAPRDLWENRPDLRAEMARLEAAQRREKASVRGALPTVGVSGQSGWSYQDIYDMESQQQWTVGASVSVPILSGGANASAVSAARASTDAAAHTANNAFLSAVAEVEGAIAQEQAAVAAWQAAQTQAEAAELAYQAALAQYQNGHGSYLQLSQLLATHFQAELSELSAHRSALGARLTLHQALGGAWTASWTESAE